MNDPSHVETIVIKRDGSVEAHGVFANTWTDCVSLTILVIQDGAIAQGAGAPTRPVNGNVNNKGEGVWILPLEPLGNTPPLSTGSKADAHAVGAMDSNGELSVVQWETKTVPVTQQAGSD